MKRNTLNVAIAAALAATAGSAAAFDTTSYNSGNTTVVNISGSSATNTQLKLYAQNVLCGSNQVLLSNDTNNFAVVCQPNSLSLSTGKTYIAVVKDSSGGSGNGIGPLISHATLSFMNVFSCNNTTLTCATTSAVPDIGLSDEEPALLVAAGATTGDVTKLNAAPLNVVTFGVPVTLGLRNALQNAQISAGVLPAACNSGDETEACMPSLTKAQITSIFAGQATNWSQFGLSSNKIYVARRVISSGTQTGSRVFFLNQPCSAVTTLPQNASFIGGDTVGNLKRSPETSPETNTRADACNGTTSSYVNTRVFDGSGSGDVERCISNHERNGRWAISINSTEFPAVSNDTFEVYATGGGSDSSTTANNSAYQRHIKIDGYAPTTYNVASGHYGDWVEASMNTSNVYSLSTDASSLLSDMEANFNEAGVLATLNNGFNTTALLHLSDSSTDSGILAPSHSLDLAGGPAVSVTKSFIHSTPVNFFTHNVSGANTCQPAVMEWDTGLPY